MKNIKYMYLKKYDYIQKKEKYRKKNFLYFFLIDINFCQKTYLTYIIININIYFVSIKLIFEYYFSAFKFLSYKYIHTYFYLFH